MDPPPYLISRANEVSWSTVPRNCDGSREPDRPPLIELGQPAATTTLGRGAELEEKTAAFLGVYVFIRCSAVVFNGGPPAVPPLFNSGTPPFFAVAPRTIPTATTTGNSGARV